MKSKIVLTSVLAGAMAMGAIGMISPARALDLGVSAGSGGANAGLSARSRVSANGDIDDNNDASGGIMARSNNNIYADTEADERMREEESRMSGSVHSSTAAGADAEADLRNQIRSGGTNGSLRAGAGVDVDTDADARPASGLFGLSVGSNISANTSGSFNN